MHRPVDNSLWRCRFRGQDLSASQSKPRLVTNSYLLAAFVLAAMFWVIESVIHVAIFHAGTFHSELFTADPHELWKRVLLSAMVILFGLYAQHGINVRRRTEAALRTSEQKYRTLIEKAMNPVFLFDERGRFLEFNQATLDFFQFDDATLRSKSYRELGLAEEPSGSDSDQGCRPRLGRSELDFRVNGDAKSMALNIVPLPLERSDTPYYYGIGHDITERKRAEQDLRLAHEELNQIFQTASSAMRVINRDFTVLKVNQRFTELSGVDQESAVGTKCYEMFPGDRCHTDQCPLRSVLAGADEIEYELMKTRAGGSTLTCLLTARPFVDADGHPIAVVESFKDITELSRVQAALRAERDKLHHILFQQAEGVSILRNDFTIEYQNRTLREEIGECLGVPCFSAFRGADSPCDPCYMHHALDRRRLQRCNLDTAGGRTYEHTYTPFCDTDGEEKIVLSRRDITDLTASQAAAIRSEQMAAVGELAAGVAHEINNPMNGIINCAQMLINRERPYREITDIARRIVREGDRVASIVASLLSFARRDAQHRTAASIEELLSEALTLVGAQMRNDAIVLDVEIPPELPRVTCFEQEVQQVVLNLLNNSRYALNRKYSNGHTKKRIEIRAGTEVLGDQRLVRLSIRDLGIGIPATIIDKVMHPFFSTKPKGEGTGLGLSISRDIIVKNAGLLSIESEEGEHTTVTIMLPAASPRSVGGRA